MMRNESPSFFMITGHPRSGTTLITEVLSRHAQVYIPQETHFFDNPASKRELGNYSLRRDWRLGVCKYLDLNERLKEEIIEIGGIDDFLNFLSTRQPQDAHEVFFALLSWIAEKKMVQYVGEKTPAHIRCAAAVGAAAPSLRVINIVRDPRDVAVSLKNVSWGHESAVFWSFRWQRFQRRARAAQRQLGDRFLQVRYEDFVADALSWTRRMCDFLNLPFHKAQLEVGAARTYDVATEPWKAQASQAVSQSRIGRWRDHLDPRDVRRIEAALGEELVALGYELSGAQAERLPRLRDTVLAAAETGRVALERQWQRMRERSSRA